MDAEGKATSDQLFVAHIFHMKVIASPCGLLDLSGCSKLWKPLTLGSEEADPERHDRIHYRHCQARDSWT